MAAPLVRCVRRLGKPCRVVVGDTSSWDAVESGTSIGVFTTRSQNQGTFLLFATGSDEHLAGLVEIARSRGLTLNAGGLHRGSQEIHCETEAAVYAALGLPFIEPELREGRDELKWALAGTLPRLIKESTCAARYTITRVFSDGSNTLDEMAAATRQMGLRYFGVCDHSQSAAYAGGLKFEKVLEQHALADALNARNAGQSFRIFKGIESDILERGELDYTPEQLARFDFVVASVHSRFELSAKDQTARLVAAARNPFTTILGHPTGRILLERPEYKFDLAGRAGSLRGTRRGRRDQRRPAPLRPGLALASARLEARLPALHQPRRARHAGPAKFKVGRGHRPQRRRAGGEGLELHGTQRHRNPLRRTAFKSQFVVRSVGWPGSPSRVPQAQEASP